MASLTQLLLFGFVATLCSAHYPLNFNNGRSRSISRSTMQSDSGMQSDSVSSSRRSVSAVARRFPIKELKYAARQYHYINDYHTYLELLSNEITDQSDFENGQFARIVHEVTLDAHNTHPDVVPTKDVVNSAFDASFAVAMGNYTWPTQEKLRSVVQNIKSLNHNLCRIATFILRHINDPERKLQEELANYIREYPYGANQVAGLLAFGELDKLIVRNKFRQAKSEIAKSAASFALLHRKEVVEVATAIDKLWHETAMIEDLILGCEGPRP